MRPCRIDIAKLKGPTYSMGAIFAKGHLSIKTWPQSSYDIIFCFLLEGDLLISDELGKKLADGDRHRMEDWRRIVGALNTEKRKLQSYLDHQQSTNSNPQVDTSSIDFDISSIIMELDRRVRRSGDDLKALNDGLTAKVTEKDSKIAGLRYQFRYFCLRGILSASLGNWQSQFFRFCNSVLRFPII